MWYKNKFAVLWTIVLIVLSFIEESQTYGDLEPVKPKENGDVTVPTHESTERNKPLCEQIDCSEIPKIKEIVLKMYEIQKAIDESTVKIIHGKGGKSAIKKLIKNEILLDHYKFMCTSVLCKDAMKRFNTWKSTMGSGKIKNRWGRSVDRVGNQKGQSVRTKPNRERRGVDTLKRSWQRPSKANKGNSLFDSEKHGLSLIEQFLALRKLSREILEHSD